MEGQNGGLAEEIYKRPSKPYHIDRTGGLGVLSGSNFEIGTQDSFDGGNGEYEHYRIT